MLHQGRIEDYFLDFISRTSKNVSIQRSGQPVDLHFEDSLVEENEAWPISVRIRRSKHDEMMNGWSTGDDELLQCKYLIGCDGAHSWVREQLGLVTEGGLSPYGA